MVGSARCAWLGSARATASRLPPAACRLLADTAS